MKQDEIFQIAEEQNNNLATVDNSITVKRELWSQLPVIRTHALVISGIRRCGKSTLMQQFMQENFKDFFFLNFEDIRLYNFETKDFILLNNVINNSGKRSLFFDEIQIVEGWEMFVRQKLDEGFQVSVTGSNAQMLSAELGTKLTGRHITKELYPFSYREFIKYKNLKANANSFSEYCTVGGFPEYIQTGIDEILEALIDDIIHRDISTRYGIKDIVPLKRLCSYILSNSGTLVSPTKLTQVIGVKAPSTILNYFNYFETSYFVAMMPKFDWSLKAQMLAPKKMYVIDPGFIQIGSTNFSENRGHILETIIYWELRRKYKELYYFNQNNCECDFLVRDKSKVVQAFQVCWEINSDNEEREVRGIAEAMQQFKLDKGIIITANQKDTVRYEDFFIDVVPVYEFLG